MCGRRVFGKGFSAGFAALVGCCHVFDLFDAVLMTAGPNAFRGSAPKSKMRI
jgi:hypothetical protein